MTRCLNLGNNLNSESFQIRVRCHTQLLFWSQICCSSKLVRGIPWQKMDRLQNALSYLLMSGCIWRSQASPNTAKNLWRGINNFWVWFIVNCYRCREKGRLTRSDSVDCIKGIHPGRFPRFNGWYPDDSFEALNSGSSNLGVFISNHNQYRGQGGLEIHTTTERYVGL